MKIEEQVLSIEQMKHLQELGVDTSDASMCWVAGEDTSTDEGELYLIIPNNFLLPYNIPTYTIGDLIDKLPVSINCSQDRKILIEGEYTEVRYMNDSYYCPLFYSHSLFIELLYNLLCEIAENHKELLKVKK